MWCSQCQQDVPGVAVREDGHRIRCARCSALLRGPADPPATAATESAFEPDAESQMFVPVVAPTPAAPAQEDWDLDADLAAVTRMMRTLRIDAPTAPAPIEPSAARRSVTATPDRGPLRPVNSRPAPPRRAQAFAWPALMLGMMAFTCGGVLLAWSFATGRGDLWTYGMPTVLGGQGLLVLGLVLQLEGLWQNNRDTRETLDELDRELAELRHATALLTSSHSAPGQSFYAHLAEGASPHLLLSDVKGQLDVIAMRLAEVRK